MEHALALPTGSAYVFDLLPEAAVSETPDAERRRTTFHGTSGEAYEDRVRRWRERALRRLQRPIASIERGRLGTGGQPRRLRQALRRATPPSRVRLGAAHPDTVHRIARRQIAAGRRLVLAAATERTAAPWPVRPNARSAPPRAAAHWAAVPAARPGAVLTLLASWTPVRR
jgi:hypothetical protein